MKYTCENWNSGPFYHTHTHTYMYIQTYTHTLMHTRIHTCLVCFIGGVWVSKGVCEWVIWTCERDRERVSECESEGVRESLQFLSVCLSVSGRRLLNMINTQLYPPIYRLIFIALLSLTRKSLLWTVIWYMTILWYSNNLL